MKNIANLALATAAFMMSSAYAAAPSGAPSGTMGLCKDGTYSSSAEKKGACRGHDGVKEWYGEAATPSPAATTSERAPAPPVSMAPPPATKTTTTTSSAAGRTSGAPMEQPAPGGGAGKVWANTNTKVYHCSGDKYYGTTKKGEYMSESDAKAKGYHADHGKACA